MKYDAGTISKAIKEIEENKHKSIQEIANQFGLPRRTLSYHFKRYRSLHSNDYENKVGLLCGTAVFNSELENELISYVVNSFSRSTNIDLRDICTLAYRFAIINKLKVPQSWIDRKAAGHSWYTSFLERNSVLLIKLLKVINLSRTTRYFESSVELFFDAFEQLILKHKIKMNHIYYVNAVNIAISDLLDSNQSKVKRDELVTIILTLSAAARILRPIYVFPKAGNTVSQTLKKNNIFDNLLSQFINKIKYYKRCPYLILLAYDDFHATLKSSKLAVRNQISILTFPENYPRQLKPLNSMLKELKSKVCDEIIQNATTDLDETITLQHIQKIKIKIPGLIKKVYAEVVTPENIEQICKVMINFSDNRDRRKSKVVDTDVIKEEMYDEIKEEIA